MILLLCLFLLVSKAYAMDDSAIKEFINNECKRYNENYTVDDSKHFLAVINIYARSRPPNLDRKYDPFGSELMHFAAFFGDDDLIEYLYHNKVNINENNSHGHSPLYFAIQKRQLLCISKLLALKANVTNDHLVEAIKINDKFLLKLLLNKGLNSNVSYCLDAVYDMKLLLILLSNGLTINQFLFCNCSEGYCIHNALLLNKPKSMSSYHYDKFICSKNYMPIIKLWTNTAITSLDSALARHDVNDINYFLEIENPWEGKINAYSLVQQQYWRKHEEGVLSLYDKVENAYINNLLLMAPIFTVLSKDLIVKIISIILLEE